MEVTIKKYNVYNVQNRYLKISLEIDIQLLLIQDVTENDLSQFVRKGK